MWPAGTARRSLLVPNIKDAGAMNFQQFMAAFDDIVARARAGKLTPADFQGTTISLTNPGTVGTQWLDSAADGRAGRHHRHRRHRLSRRATEARRRTDARRRWASSKVMTLTCTYDHRIIQGAESRHVSWAGCRHLLDGEDGFYDEIFADLQMPHQPVRWEARPAAAAAGWRAATRIAEIAKQAAVCN